MGKRRNRNPQAAAQRAKYMKMGYPSSQLGGSGKPKPPVAVQHHSRKQATQRAGQISKSKGQFVKHGPHAHFKHHHAHSVNKKGEIPTTAPGKTKFKQTWGKKGYATSQGQNLKSSRYRQPKQSPAARKAPAPAPAPAAKPAGPALKPNPAPTRGRGR